MNTLICIECGEEKPITAFNRDARLATGRQAACKECQRKRTRISTRKRGNSFDVEAAKKLLKEREAQVIDGKLRADTMIINQINSDGYTEISIGNDLNYVYLNRSAIKRIIDFLNEQINGDVKRK
jgi:hypothetical protein